MKKFLSIIFFASFALSGNAFAGNSTATEYHPCQFTGACGGTTPMPEYQPNPFTEYAPTSHGVSEPLGMLAGLTALTAFIVARKRAK